MWTVTTRLGGNPSPAPEPEPERHTGPIADPIVPEEPPTELVPDPERPVEPAEGRVG